MRVQNSVVLHGVEPDSAFADASKRRGRRAQLVELTPMDARRTTRLPIACTAPPANS
jgi:hypothetical protein